MNMGLIVGRVFFSNGKPAKGASVRLVKIMGLYLASQSETVCNSKGKFALKFPWSGTEFGNDLSIPVTMEVVSSIEIISKDRFTKPIYPTITPEVTYKVISKEIGWRY